MYLIIMHIFSGNYDMPCAVAETQEKAQEWINNKMDGYVYNGDGVYQIKPIELYK